MVKIKLKTKKEIYLDGGLKNALDTLVYNVKNDWGFVIIITGDRMVRTGKLVLAMSVCAYLAEKLETKYDINNVFFDHKEMINQAQVMPKYSVIHYDEAREGLAASKHMGKLQQDLMDYFNECGQLNHIFVLVLPDFFSLKEDMAVGRSELLLNVYRSEDDKLRDVYGDGKLIPVSHFKRGQFQLFNRKRKQKLFDMSRARRQKNYSLVPANGIGSFTNNYPIGEEVYREKKREALSRFAERKKDALNERPIKSDLIRDEIIKELLKDGKTHKEIAEYLTNKYNYDVSRRYITELIGGLS